MFMKENFVMLHSDLLVQEREKLTLLNPGSSIMEDLRIAALPGYTGSSLISWRSSARVAFEP